jgi:cardiolipin synthase A/B
VGLKSGTSDVKKLRRRLLGALALAIVGVILYWFTPMEEAPRIGLDHEFTIESEDFRPTIAGATGTPFAEGNRIEVFHNGDHFYPPMLEAIEGASQSITIEAYIYWEGQIGQRFADVLASKAQAGIPVLILLDSVGSSTIGDAILETLEGGGCRVAWYHPVAWYTVDRVNNRTHRKSIIVDGRVGFTGGAGIADHWLGNAEDPEHWRDTNIRIEGPAVMPIQTGFAQNWLETTGELVTGPAFYPIHEPVGSLAAMSLLSSPETGSSNARVMYYLSIACARRTLWIANPYFIPDERAIDLLVAARKRGVDVKIMVAGVHNDNRLARLNSVHIYGRLLEGGVEIYEFEPTMLHQKYMVCDGIWSTVGTTNFDNRSFALNEENNVCVYDRGLAGQIEAAFRVDLERCHKVELEAWRNRGIGQKTLEFFATIIEEQV